MLILTSFFWRKRRQVIFPEVGLFSQGQILLLTEVDMKGRDVYFIVGAKKWILQKIFVTFCCPYSAYLECWT